MVRVRHAHHEDLPRLAEIARHAVTAARWTAQQYEEVLSSGRVVLVIEEDGEPAGFLAAQEIEGEWELENIAIRGPARRRGLGSHLLGEFLRHVSNHAGTEVVLEVRESNHAARALYEKWAFIEAGRRKAYYQDPPEDALILKFYFPQGA